MIDDLVIAEVKQLLDEGFSYRYIYLRTGVSRPIIADVASGKRKPHMEKKRNEYKAKFKGTPQEYRQIQDDAWEALRLAGRDTGEHEIAHARKDTAF
jgi:hypothetical protein